MKNAIVYLIFFAAMFIGCSDKKQEISFNEFDRLVTADSIQSLQVCDDEKAVITKRSSLPGDEKLVLLIPSAESFRDQLNNRYSKNTISSISFVNRTGANVLFFNFIPVLLLLNILVLFFISAIDILKSRFVSDMEKLIWVLIVIFVPVAGPILYLIIGRKQKLPIDK